MKRILLSTYEKQKSKILILFSIVFFISIGWPSLLTGVVLSLISFWSVFFYYSKKKKFETIIWLLITGVCLAYLVNIIKAIS